jgi:hypothetical protein
MSMEDTARVQPMIDPDASGNRLGDDTPPVSTLIGVFDNENAAHDAIQDLKLAGFSGDSISFVSRTGDDSILRNDADITDAADVHDDKGPEGALVGSLTGGTLGAVLGFLLAGGTALIPGVGPVIAAGVFGATVTGALVGGSVGGITGGLAGMGVPDEDAGEYENYFKEGKPIVAVRTLNGNQMESARDVFDRHGANATRTYGDTRLFNDNATTGVDTSDTIAPVPGTGAGAMAAAAYTTNNNATNRPVMPPDEPTSRTTDTLDYGSADTTTAGSTNNDDLRGMVRSADETDDYDTTRRAGGTFGTDRRTDNDVRTDRRDDFNTPAATMAAGGVYPPVNRDDDVMGTPSKYDSASIDDVTDPEQVRNPRDEEGNIMMPKAPFPPQNKMS